MTTFTFNTDPIPISALQRYRFGLAVHQPGVSPAQTADFSLERFRPASAGVLEQLHDPLHAAELAGRLGHGPGFLAGGQAHHVDRAVVGHHLWPGESPLFTAGAAAVPRAR